MSPQSSQKKLSSDLNAKSATIILLAYLGAQLLCGVGSAICSNIIAATYEIHNIRQIYAISDSLEPATLFLTFLLGGIAMIAMSLKLIPEHIKDTRPTGAAWSFGRLNGIMVALFVGLIFGICAHFLNVFKAQASYQNSGPVSRVALTHGLAQVILVIVAILLAPPVEEMLFRGVLYGGYRKSFGPTRAAVLTTCLFMIWHVAEYVHFPLGMVVILVEALLALWCRLFWGAIGPAVAVHVGFNSISVSIIVFKLLH